MYLFVSALTFFLANKEVVRYSQKRKEGKEKDSRVTESRPTPASHRLAYIDMLKGCSCQIMVFAHALTLQFGRLEHWEKVLFSFIIFPAGLFFFASGMNVVNFLQNAARKRNFRADRFFLLSAVALFILSLPFSLNRNNLLMMQIFQGIAVCTACAYLCLRIKLPDWALVVLAFGLYLVWLRNWHTVAPALAELRKISDDEALAGQVRDLIADLPIWKRVLFANFSLLPWLNYMLLGCAWYRRRQVRPGKNGRWIALFIGMILLGLVSTGMPRFSLQPRVLDNNADMLFRNTPLFFFLWSGLTGLSAIAAATWYRGAEHIKNPEWRIICNYIEYSGRESLMFFVWHWVILMGCTVLISLLNNLFNWSDLPLSRHLVWIISLPATAVTLPMIVRLGEEWRGFDNFPLVAGAVLLFSTLIPLIAILRTGETRFWLSLYASVVFGMYYPMVRQRLNRWSIRTDGA